MPMPLNEELIEKERLLEPFIGGNFGGNCVHAVRRVRVVQFGTGTV